MEVAGGPEHVVTWQRKFEVYEAWLSGENQDTNLDMASGYWFSVIGGSS